MLKQIIADGQGSGRNVGVTTDNALKVSIVSQAANTIPTEQLIRQKQLRRFLLNGTSRDMNIDGSVTPVEFYVGAEEGVTKWFTGIRIIMHDENMELNTNDFRRFGRAAITPGLTNGIELFTTQEGIITSLVADAVQTIGDFMKDASDYVNFINAIAAQTDYLHFDLDFDVPVVLPPGTSDRITIKINDDLTALTLMQARLRGYQEIVVAE